MSMGESTGALNEYELEFDDSTMMGEMSTYSSLPGGVPLSQASSTLEGSMYMYLLTYIHQEGHNDQNTPGSPKNLCHPWSPEYN